MSNLAPRHHASYLTAGQKRQKKGNPEANRKGIGFILDKISSITQIINDERPQAQVQDALASDKTASPTKLTSIISQISKKSYRWFLSEYFYSFVDKPFFQENELVETLEAAGLPKLLLQREWALVRQSLADQAGQNYGTRRPKRLFSRQFINEEKRKLDAHRSIFHEIMRQYQQQGVTLNIHTGKLSEFRLDTSVFTQFTDVQIEQTLQLV